MPRQMPTTLRPRFRAQARGGGLLRHAPNRPPRFPTSTPPPGPSSHPSGFSIRSQKDSLGFNPTAVMAPVLTSVATKFNSGEHRYYTTNPGSVTLRALGAAARSNRRLRHPASRCAPRARRGSARTVNWWQPTDMALRPSILYAACRLRLQVPRVLSNTPQPRRATNFLSCASPPHALRLNSRPNSLSCRLVALARLPRLTPSPIFIASLAGDRPGTAPLRRRRDLSYIATCHIHQPGGPSLRDGQAIAASLVTIFTLLCSVAERRSPLPLLLG